MSRQAPPPWDGVGLSEREERATLERLGIDPTISRRHQMMKLYPYLRGSEKATTEHVETLVTGALQRYHAQFAAEDRRRRRLRRVLPCLPLAAAAAAALLFVARRR